MSRNAPRNEKRELCACAVVETAVKLREKLLTCCNPLRAKSRAEFYFVQRFAQQPNCETTHITLCNSPAGNLSRNGIARQVAKKIARCNRAFILLHPIPVKTKVTVHYLHTPPPHSSVD